MFKLILHLFVLALLNSQLGAQTPPKEGTATVAGIVTLKGEPARNVSVVLQASGSYDQKQTPRVKTDEAGRFRFERVKAGRYTLGAVAPGFVVPNENQSSIQGKTINVADGENAETEIALRLGGVITGRITDSRGNPVVGEGVQLLRINPEGKPERVRLGPNGMFYGTDDRGIYRLYGLAAGRYLVGLGFEQRPNSIAFTTARVFYPFTYYPGVTSQSQAKTVEVGEGGEITGIDIVVGELKKNYDVSGRVTYAENGQPAIGMEIGYGVLSTFDKTVGVATSFNAPTNSAGEFRMPNILPGKYAAAVQPGKEDNYYSEPVLFEITDSDVNDLELKLHRGSTITGTAVAEGVTDPAITAKVSALRFFVNVKSQVLTARDSRSPFSLSPNGGFTIKGLPPGNMSFSLVASTVAKGFSIVRIERDGAPQGDGINMNSAEQITGVRLVLGYGSGIVRGQVRIVGNLPEPIRLSVRARRVDTGLNVGSTGTIDVRGLFRIENLPLGDYEIFLSPSFTSAEAPPGYEELKKLLAEIRERVTVGAGESQVNLLLDLGRKGGN